MPCLFALFAWGAASHPASAATLHVGSGAPGAYSTVQGAIDAAAPGDTVIVHPGRYRETISMVDVDMHLISSAGPASTILDGAGSGPVIRCLGLSSDSSIQGFTITGGVTPGPLVGGGIYLAAQASPLIKGNIIAGNRAVAGGAASPIADPPHPGAPQLCETIPGSGGGIFAYLQCTPAIVDNVIMDNTAERDGGGVAFWDHAHAVLEGNRIYRNTAGRFGGGVFVGCNSSPTLERNVLAWNRALGGGGVYLQKFETEATVRRNTFYMNAATAGSGGIQCEGPCKPVIHGNLVGVAEGGGILCDPESDPTITCNVVWGASGESYGKDCFHPGGGFGDGDNAIEEVKMCGAQVGDFRPCAHPLVNECGVVGAADQECPPGACGVMKGSWGVVKAIYRDP